MELNFHLFKRWIIFSECCISHLVALPAIGSCPNSVVSLMWPPFCSYICTALFEVGIINFLCSIISTHMNIWNMSRNTPSSSISTTYITPNHTLTLFYKTRLCVITGVKSGYNKVEEYFIDTWYSIYNNICTAMYW